ncbi:terminase large subunit domain-containing protein [Pseudomonas chlororaphis]|uniref:terminase large subunit domain-containing protein n=1 Tax=Pseudomonas chlororaphis TaxID=587753 RepID=UPI001B3291F2|nr:terminase family protein [Pseudomonas chlororaphis]MBP5059747.1 terminase [Pseudomonas chlororaphis]MBP5143903.1 terminase [Pseudomonas chlororaphis]
MELRDVLAALEGLPQKERDAVVSQALEATKDQIWVPNPGPQVMAYFSEADELFYGGQAGGGKSALINGLAVTSHERTLILRRIREDAKKLAESELLGNIFDGDRQGWNGSDLIWRSGKQLIQFGGCEQETDKQRYKGDPHDLICFDEITDFLKSQYEFITIWNRSATAGQRCRIVVTGNPPTSATGLWVIQHWAAWLDPRHPNPAQPGELRWYLRDESGDEIEVDGPGPHLIGTDEIYAKSRTFIPAKLSDNPDLAADGEYKRILDALPKELREAYRDGKFSASLRDEANQTIPTAWVTAAMARWKPVPPIGIPMCAVGVDVAQGGSDKTVLAWRHDGWYAPLIAVPGSETPGGTDVAGLVIAKRRDGCKVIIDIGGGWGGDAYAHLRENGVDAVSYMGVKPSQRRTDDNLLKFFNVRTEAYWRFREALNPDQPGGSSIMLPDDQELLSDLTAPTYEIKRANTGGVIHLEPKEQLVKRLGRSPDKGDAVVMAWFAGAKAITDARIWGQQHKGRAAPRVIMRKR